MIETIFNYLKDDHRVLPAYSNFLRSQSRYVRLMTHRFRMAPAHESRGLKLLRHILSLPDYDYLLSKNDNYDRYLDHLQYVRNDLIYVFDKTRRGSYYRRFFFKEGGPLATNEYLVPIEDMNTMSVLPFHSNKWDEWKDVHPVRLWFCDTDEYSIELLTDQIAYRALPPESAIILIDVIGLILKYFIWINKQMKHETEQRAYDTPQQYFLHKYVFDQFHQDLTDCWLLRQLDNVLSLEDDLDSYEFEKFRMSSTGQYGRISLNFSGAMKELTKEVSNIKNSQSPSSLMGSQLLIDGSLYRRAELSMTSLSAPRYRQYEYIRYMMNRDLFSIIKKLYNLRKTPTRDSMNRAIAREYKRMIARRPWNICTDINLKYWLEKDIRRVLSECEK